MAEMNDEIKTREQLITELQGLRQQAAELQESESQRWRTEGALQESEKRFRSIAETASDAIIIFDIHENIFFWNKAAKDIFGYRANETRGRLLASIMSAPSAKVLRREIEQLVSTGESGLTRETVEMTGLKKDGSEFLLELSLAMWRTGEEAFFTMIARDVTGRRGVEEALRVSDERYRAVAESEVTGIGITDPEENFIFVNPAFAEMLGYTQGELAGMNLSLLATPEELAGYQEQTQQRREGIHGSYETALRRKDGRVLNIIVSASPLTTSDGSFQGTLAAIVDITERKQAEEALRKAHEGLEQRTADLERRTMQLQAAAEVARGAAAIHDVTQLFDETVHLISRQFGFYHAGIFLVDDAREYAVLRAASSEGGQRMLSRGHKLRVGEVGIVGYAAGSGKPRIALDVDADAVFFDNPDLPQTRSEMALPLRMRDRIIGVLDVQSTKAEAFNDEDVAILQTMADQVTLAIENARLLEESQRSVRELQVAYREHVRTTWEGLETIPAFEYDRVEVTRASPELYPAAAEALSTGQLVTVAGLEDGRSALAAPLRLRDQVIGAITLEEMDEARPWTDDEIQLVEEVSTQVALALESARLFEETQSALDETEEQAHRLALLNEMSDQLGRTANFDEILDIAAAKTSQIFTSDRASVAMLTDAGDSFEIFALRGEEGATPTGTMVPTEGSEMEIAVRERRLVIERDDRRDSLGDIRSFMVAPLFSGARAIGTLNVASKQPNTYDQRAGNLLLQIASLLSSTIENRRLFEETRIRAEELAVLNELAQALTAQLNVEQVLEEVHRGASHLLDTTNFSIGLYDPERDEITMSFLVSESEIDRQIITFSADQGFSGYIVRNRTSVLVEENILEWLEERGMEPVGEPALSWLGVPLLVGDRVLGVINIQSFTTPRLYDEHARDLLSAIANQAAIALQNVYLFEETRSRAEELAVLNELAQALTARLNVDEVLEEIYRGASLLLRTPNFYVGFYDPDKNEIDFVFNVSESEIDRQIITMSADQGLGGYIVRNRASVLIKENYAERLEELGVELVGEPVSSWLGVPLLVGDRVLGAMAVQDYVTRHAYDEHDQELLTAIASQAAIALQNARLFEETVTRAEELAVLNELIQALTARLNVEQVLDEAYRGASRLLDTTNFYMALYDPDEDEVTFALDGTEGKVSKTYTTRRAGHGITEYVIHNRQPLLMEENVSEWLEELGIEMIGPPALSWLGVPLVVGGQVLGVMAVQSYTTPRLYNERDRDLLSSIASQTAIALQNARLFEGARIHAEELAVLNELAQTLSARLDVEQVIEEAFRGTSRLLDTTNFAIGLYDSEKDEIAFPFFTTESEIDRQIVVMPASQGLNGYVVRNRTSLLIRENMREWHEERGMQIVGELALCWLGVPLMLGDRVLGVMSVQSFTTPRLYDEHDRDLLTAVASQAAITLQNARLFEETQSRLAQLTALGETASAVASTLELDKLLNLITQQATTLLQGDGGIINLVDWENKEDEAVTAIGSQASALGVRNPLEDALSGWVALHNEPVISNQLQSDSRVDPRFRSGEIPGQSAVIAPLTVKDQVVGTLAIMDKQGGEGDFDQADLDLLTAFANQAATAIENTRLFEEAHVRAEELAVLNELAQALTARLNVEQVVEETYRGASRLLDTTSFYIALYDHETESVSFPLALESGQRVQWQPRQKGKGLTEYIIRSRSPLLMSENLPERMEELGIEEIGATALSWLGVPLLIGGRVLGVMTAQSYTTPRLYDEHARDLLTAIASQMAIAIQNARLFEETERRATQLAAAADVARDATAILDVEQLLDEVVHLISERFGFYHAGVFLLDERGEYAVLQAGSSEGGHRMLGRGHRLKVGEVGMVGYVTETGEPRIALDVGADAAFFDNPDLPETRSAMTLPLKVRDRVIGALDVQSTEEAAFSGEDVAVLQTMADQLATAIENARLFEGAQSDARRRALINEVLQAAAASLDPEELLHQAGEVVSQRLEAPSALFTWDPRREELYPVAVHAADATDVPLPEDLQVTHEMNPVLLEAIRGRRTCILEITDDVSGPLVDVARQAQAQSIIYVPLISRDQILGAIGLAKFEEQPLVDVEFAELVAGNLSVALENARLFQEAVRTSERLAEVDRIKTQFLANMSHELRTPLNSIIGFSRVVLKGIDGPLTDQQREDLDAIHNSGQHLLGLINDMLDISRIEAGKIELSFEKMDLREIISGVMSTAIALVKDKPVELQQSIPDNLPLVTADARRVRQVLLNLVANAAKFTDAGFVHVGAEVSPDEVTVSVADSGPGISPRDLEVIFEPFTQADASPSRKYGGTGLGLTISTSFVELHGGRIWVESEVGVGSTFYFTLPIEGPPFLQEEQKLPPDEMLPISSEAIEERSSKLILCVDDDEGVITLFRRYLYKQGYRVAGLTEATRVVEEAKRLHPHAITLDVMMPQKDGWQVIQELKADPETRHIPVVMCTIVGEKDRGMSLGAADYLVKPIIEQDLLVALDRLNREAGRHQVLVVDDQPEDRELLRRMIESQEGYEVVEAASGQDAIAMIQQIRPHIIVLDLLMPEVDGFAVLEAVKADATTRSIPIIVVTAKDLTTEDRQLLNHRTEALIQKGVLGQEELLEDVVAALRRLDRAPLSERSGDGH